LPTVEELCVGARRVAVLESIVDPTNVGAIFRSAAALNMDAVLVTPTCCDPLYRRAVRVSMGTVFQVPWARLDSLDALKKAGFVTLAMALKPDALSLDDPTLQTFDKLAVVLGTEGDGLTRETIEGCDYTVVIPMAHGVDSLNVGNAAAVAFWALRKR
ncbi:MAG: RNA methyltransferase, partial [Clostridia bacterium]|nr:RNA methyltransferase [Clostridia bacterium]